MYDLYLDILFMRARQRELAQEVANQALVRQARRDTRRRRGHMLWAIRDRLRVLGLWFRARQGPQSPQRRVIPVPASDSQQEVAPKSAAATQESRANDVLRPNGP
jgi:hypothetical protein